MKNFDTPHSEYSSQYSQQYGLQSVFTAQISSYQVLDATDQAQHKLSNSKTYQRYARAKHLLKLYEAKHEQ